MALATFTHLSKAELGTRPDRPRSRNDGHSTVTATVDPVPGPGRVTPIRRISLSRGRTATPLPSPNRSHTAPLTFPSCHSITSPRNKRLRRLGSYSGPLLLHLRILRSGRKHEHGACHSEAGPCSLLLAPGSWLLSPDEATTISLGGFGGSGPRFQVGSGGVCRSFPYLVSSS